MNKRNIVLCDPSMRKSQQKTYGATDTTTRDVSPSHIQTGTQENATSIGDSIAKLGEVCMISCIYPHRHKHTPKDSPV